MEMLVINENDGNLFRLILGHTSIDANERKKKWELLKARKHIWGNMWVIGGTSTILEIMRKRKVVL